MIKSPCIRVCRIDEWNGLCNGCKRTLKEIQEWSAYPESTRQRILDGIKYRKYTRNGADIDSTRLADLGAVPSSSTNNRLPKPL